MKGFIKEIVSTSTRLYTYFDIYIKNFKNLRVHFMGIFVSAMLIVCFPNLTVEWSIVITFMSLITSGVIIGWVLEKEMKESDQDECD